MFEVDPNLWLQSFATPWLTWLMQVVSQLGLEWFYAAAVLAIGFGLRLRPMLGVMLALLLASLATHAMKQEFGLPRPVQVDARVLHKGEANTRWLVRHGGAESAFALPAPDAIVAARAVPEPDFGFISGHTAAATAFCASLLLAFAGLRRRKAAFAFFAAWPVLMALSRMYLGRHFLGDVLGGACAGLLAAAVAWWAWRLRDRRTWLLPALAVLACIASWWIPALDPATLGQLLGLALLVALLSRNGWPPDAVPAPGRQAMRVVLAFCMYALGKICTEALLQRTGWGNAPLLLTPVVAASTLLVLGGSIWLARRLRLYPAVEA
jgi:membrane-associated phospholipid phosphatase